MKDRQLREIRLHESGFGVDILIIGGIKLFDQFNGKEYVLQNPYFTILLDLPQGAGGEVCLIIEFLVADASKVSKHGLAENYDMGFSIIYLKWPVNNRELFVWFPLLHVVSFKVVLQVFMCRASAFPLSIFDTTFEVEQLCLFRGLIKLVLFQKVLHDSDHGLSTVGSEDYFKNRSPYHFSGSVREKLYNFTAHLACGEIEPLGHIILVKGFLQHEDLGINSEGLLVIELLVVHIMLIQHVTVEHATLDGTEALHTGISSINFA